VTGPRLETKHHGQIVRGHLVSLLQLKTMSIGERFDLVEIAHAPGGIARA